jgi:hypothetical protein
MKTIEEVKEFFKNAKVVECLLNKNYVELSKVDVLRIYKYNGIFKIDYCLDKGRIGFITYTKHLWNKDQGFAKIIEYKDEKLYTLKEECHKYIGAQTRYTTTTLEDWNLPLSMLDEVKEVETAYESNYEPKNKIITYTIYIPDDRTLSGFQLYLDNATKEFFNSKNK